MPQRIHGPGDFITQLKVNPGCWRADRTLPERVAVRIRGRRKVIWLATSLLDAQRYPAQEVVALYARRWRMETLFREMKTALGADALRSKVPAGVRKELAARVRALNVVRVLMLQAAQEQGIEPERLSFSHALRAVLVWVLAGGAALAGSWERQHQALREMAAALVPPRPGRNEPRAKRRETKHYPALRCTRAQWRLNYVT